MYEMINDSTFLQFEEEDEIDSSETQPNVSDIPNNILIIEKMFSLKKVGKVLS